MLRIISILGATFFMIVGYQNCTGQLLSFNNSTILEKSGEAVPGEFSEDDSISFNEEGELVTSEGAPIALIEIEDLSGPEELEDLSGPASDSEDTQVSIAPQGTLSSNPVVTNQGNQTSQPPVEVVETTTDIDAPPIDVTETTTDIDAPPIDVPQVQEERSPASSNSEYICILKGPGHSVRLGYTNDQLIRNDRTPGTICMSKNACLTIVSEKFEVKGAFHRGFCPQSNPHVFSLDDNEMRNLVDSI